MLKRFVRTKYILLFVQYGRCLPIVAQVSWRYEKLLDKALYSGTVCLLRFNTSMGFKSDVGLKTPCGSQTTTSVLAIFAVVSFNDGLLLRTFANP